MFECLFVLTIPVVAVAAFYMGKARRKQEIIRLEQMNSELESKLKKLQVPNLNKDEKKAYEDRIDALIEHNQFLDRIVSYLDSRNPFFDDSLREDYVKALQSPRLARSLAHDLRPPKSISVSATIPSFTSGQNYTTNLKECTCQDFRNRQVPCKHMISLALYLNAAYNMNGELNLLLQSMVSEREQLQKLKEK